SDGGVIFSSAARFPYALATSCWNRWSASLHGLDMVPPLLPLPPPVGSAADGSLDATAASSPRCSSRVSALRADDVQVSTAIASAMHVERVMRVPSSRLPCRRRPTVARQSAWG